MMIRIAMAGLLLAASPLAAQTADPAAEATPPEADAMPLPKDRRERVIFLCMAEAKAKAKADGVQEVTLREVQDTDLKSDDRASMRAKIGLISVTDKGKIRKDRGTLGCSVEGDAVTRIDIDR